MNRPLNFQPDDAANALNVTIDRVALRLAHELHEDFPQLKPISIRPIESSFVRECRERQARFPFEKLGTWLTKQGAIYAIGDEKFCADELAALRDEIDAALKGGEL